MMEELVQYVIYERPTDYPDSFVVRRFQIKRGGHITYDVEPHSVSATLSEARATIPPGQVCLARSEDDDPRIREVWT